MGCSEKPVWPEAAGAGWKRPVLTPPDEAVRAQVFKNWDSIAKPLDGMGSFEALTARIGSISGSDRIDLSKKAVLVLCADNGVVEEGVSQSGQEITAVMARAIAEGKSCVCRMAQGVGADVLPVDIGINRDGPLPGVLDRNIRRGTRNFNREPAMTEEETLRAIGVGVELVRSCREKGYAILATGEMGIGNTTTSSAVAAALLGCGADAVTGRGAGLDDGGLRRKKQVIQNAIARYGLEGADPLRILSSVGGLDLAGLTGICIGGALFHVPIVLDGIASMTAALAAARLLPGTEAFLIASHRGKEPAAALLEKALGLSPVIFGELALGEGTGAVMLLSLLDLALRIYNGRTGFDQLQIAPYERHMPSCQAEREGKGDGE